MFLPPDMLCLLQSTHAKEKQSKSKRLSAFWRKKGQSESERPGDDNLLHPNLAKDVASAFCTKDIKPGLKNLSGSAPSMTSVPLDVALTPTTCRSRQKKFLRHFNVDPDEKVIDYYSCALVADILLQGHLYISKNYFAFYSNVFGYVTKLLIPTTSVKRVTKEKTAFILPNAVGIETADDRHVFSSLLSRDTTFRLMIQVWHAAYYSKIISSESPEAETEPDVDVPFREESSSPSGSESLFDLRPSTSSQLLTPSIQVVEESSQKPVTRGDSGLQSVTAGRLPRSTLLLAAATTLLIALFLSAAVLMYRVAVLQHGLALRDSQSSRALYEINEFLDSNLNNLNKVRLSLEALTQMMENDEEKLLQREIENFPTDKLKLTDEMKTSRRDQLREELRNS